MLATVIFHWNLQNMMLEFEILLCLLTNELSSWLYIPISLFMTNNVPFSSWLSVSLLQNAFQEKIVQRREAEFGRLKKERDERISQLISSRKRERETVRKLMYYLNLEEQRIERLREEEEARKREGKWILNRLYSSFVDCTCWHTSAWFFWVPFESKTLTSKLFFVLSCNCSQNGHGALLSKNEQNVA